jgi:voltage-gated potassium channel
VIIEHDPEVLEHLQQSIPQLLYLQMNATADESLLRAGVMRARGLVAALGEDKDNVFVVLSARALNPDLRIVSRLLEDHNADKLRKAGVDRFVSVNVIGGYRLASEMLRPTVIDFVEQMHRGTEELLRLEEFPVEVGGPMAGSTLGELDLGRCTGMLVIAIRTQDGQYLFNPGSKTQLNEGDVLIAMGTREQVTKLQQFVC